MVENANSLDPSIVVAERSSGLPLRRAGWSAVLIGAVVAIGLQLTFTVLGIAVGISAATGVATQRVSPISTSAGVWWLITGTISIAVGGVVLGMLWEDRSRRRLMFHAAALWGVVAIFGFSVIWSGAGIASNAALPLAIRAPDWSSPGDRPTAEERDIITEQTRNAAQTAAWWSIVGMAMGLAATIVGAVAAGPAALALRSRPSSLFPVDHSQRPAASPIQI